MATAAESLPTSEFSIGRIFALAVATVRNNFISVIFLALLFGAVPILLTSYALNRLLDAQENDSSLQSWVVVGFTMVVSTAVSVLPQAFLTRPVLAESEGRRASLAESARAGFQVLVPFLVMAFIYGLAVIAGLAMLIVPGFMLMAAWAVVGPVLAQERVSIVRSFRRSQHLTRGVRWKIVGLLLVFYAVDITQQAAIQLFSGEWESTALSAAFENPIYLALTIVAETLLAIFWCSVLAALYVELRHWKDGPTAENFAEIFS